MGARRRDLQLERYWRRAVASQAGSRQSVRAYCAGRGLAAANFYAWRRELAKRDEEASAAGRFSQRDDVTRAAAPTFVPVQVRAEVQVEVVLPDGVIVRTPVGVAADAVVSLITALRAASW